MNFNKLRVAIVCDWLTTAGGAEKVILKLHQLFPNAPIYTSIYNPQKVKGFENAKIVTSYLQNFPFAKTKHQYYVKMLPQVFESFDLDDYDLVISSSHSCAKGVITKPETLHICYCHTPMRYAWEDSISYTKNYNTNRLVKFFAPFLIHNLRIWDKLSADRVDNYIANSKTVQNRITKFYRKPSTVITPFIDLKKFKLSTKREQFYLSVGRITAYKKIDLLVDTFNELELPLKIAGTGNSIKQLAKKAKPNIQFLGYVSDEQLHELYQKAKALVFPQHEDFGIVPLEAMATGCPVIAYNQGGATETVIDGINGTFFEKQDTQHLKKAIHKFENSKWNSEKIRSSVEKFDEKNFEEKILDFISKKLETHQHQLIS